MNIRKKKRSDQRKMKRKANRKLKRIYLREQQKSRTVFDQLWVEKSNTNNQCLEKEINCLRLKLQGGN